MGAAGTSPDGENYPPDRALDLIGEVVLKDPEGKIIAQGFIDTIQCGDGRMTINTRNPSTAADISPIVREGGYAEITDTKIPEGLSSNVYRNGEPYISREEFFGSAD